MHLLLTLLMFVFSFLGTNTALMIPQLQPQRQPQFYPLPSILPRGASIPTLENYTATYVRNGAILIPNNCTSVIARSAFPTTKELNAAKCGQVCDQISASRAKPGSQRQCRFFNMYLLFQGDKNLGLQCVYFDRRWGNSWAGNTGNYDAWGKARTGGEALQIYESLAYWRSEDPGPSGCARDSGGDGVQGAAGKATEVPAKTARTTSTPLPRSTNVSEKMKMNVRETPSMVARSGRFLRRDQAPAWGSTGSMPVFVSSTLEDDEL